MLRLRDGWRITSPVMRERLGFLCALGAVACLASIIVHWSRQYPVERSPLEQHLFGDLTENDAGSIVPRPAEARVALSLPEATVPSAADVRFSDEPIPPEPLPPLPAAPLAAGDSESADQMIQPVIHEESSSTTSVWLGGDIELDVDDTADVAPVSISLPD